MKCQEIATFDDEPGMTFDDQPFRIDGIPCRVKTPHKTHQGILKCGDHLLVVEWINDAWRVYRKKNKRRKLCSTAQSDDLTQDSRRTNGNKKLSSAEYDLTAVRGP